MWEGVLGVAMRGEDVRKNKGCKKEREHVGRLNRLQVP